MALQLMKIVVSGTANVDVNPTVQRFFYVTTASTAAGTTLTIDAADFLDDSGAAVTTLPALASNNSSFNVFLNGVLQMQGISTYTPGNTGTGSLAIAVPTPGDPIPDRTPVVLEVVNYAPTSTLTLET